MQERTGILLARMNGRNADYRIVMEGEDLIPFPAEAAEAERYFPKEEAEEVWYYLDDVPPARLPAPPGLGEARLLPRMDPEDLWARNYRYLAFLDRDGNVLYQITPKKGEIHGQRLLQPGPDGGIQAAPRADGILLGAKPDAIQVQSGNRTMLIFQQIKKVFRIAPEMVGAYYELEKGTIQTFLNTGMVYLSGMDAEKIGRANIRRVREVTGILEEYSEAERQELREYISRMFPRLYYNEERQAFAMETNANLRDILYCLKDQAFLRYRDGEVCIAPHYFVRERRKGGTGSDDEG